MEKLERHSRSYLAALRARKYAAKSLTLFEQSLTSFGDFIGTDDVNAITAEDLDAYRLHLVDRGLSPATLEVYLRTVRRFFAWLADEQILFDNPAESLAIPKPPRKLLPVPTEKEMSSLLAAIDISTPCGIRDRAMIETAYSTGVRREELIALTIFDADLDASTLRVVGKGRKERIVPLGKQAVHWLRQYLKGSRRKLLAEELNTDALWISRRGKPWTYAAIAQTLNRHTKQAGLKAISPHGIRRACATHMLRAGAHPVQLQMLLGHSTLQTLSQYLRVSITDLQKAHAAQNPGR